VHGTFPKNRSISGAVGVTLRNAPYKIGVLLRSAFGIALAGLKGLLKKFFGGGRVWGVGCGVWGFTGFEVANYLIFREKVPEFSP